MSEKDQKTIEQKAYDLLCDEKYYEAFKLYQEAAKIYRSKNMHKQAAFCFTSAASCWGKKSGEATFFNAALSYEEAARESVKVGDLEYASLLYKYAAINYERDRELVNFSECFFLSKECLRRFVAWCLFNPKKLNPIVRTKEKRGFIGYIKRIFVWLGLVFSYYVWGHGERPAYTVYSGLLAVILSALAYTAGYLIKDGRIFQPDFLEALYFSVVTFTTVGYGDITPIGISKAVVMLEALSGLFIIPIFVIGLSRKYLRI